MLPVMMVSLCEGGTDVFGEDGARWWWMASSPQLTVVRLIYDGAFVAGADRGYSGYREVGNLCQSTVCCAQNTPWTNDLH